MLNKKNVKTLMFKITIIIKVVFNAKKVFNNNNKIIITKAFKYNKSLFLL